MCDTCGIGPELTGSGISVWSRGQWRVRVNGLEPFTRQRFSIAHEFKHVLDAAHEDVIYRHLPTGSRQRHTHIEAVCDAFAAALLMPKPLVKRYWYAGTRNVTVLAWRFQVSQQAMQIRLETLGLIERQPRPRYSTTSAYRVGRTAVESSGGSARHTQHNRHYHRTRRPAHVPFARYCPHLLTTSDTTPCREPAVAQGAAV